MNPEINIQPSRSGFTCNPPQINEATGEREGDYEVYPTIPFADDVDADDATDLYEAIQEDPDHPDYEFDESQLGELSIEINESSVAPDEALANQIASSSFGDTPSDVTVQFLSHKVFNGDITPQEAFTEAVDSGIPLEQLADSFNRLRHLFPPQ